MRIIVNAKSGIVFIVINTIIIITIIIIIPPSPPCLGRCLSRCLGRTCKHLCTRQPLARPREKGVGQLKRLAVSCRVAQKVPHPVREVDHASSVDQHGLGLWQVQDVAYQRGDV